jgi:serine/threonine protein kinase
LNVDCVAIEQKQQEEYSEMIGSWLNDRYRLDAEIGHGGAGVVYRAYDMMLDRAIAIKVLSHRDLGPQGRTRLLREARAAAKLNHPNIVNLYDVGEQDDLSFVIMELVEGETLYERKPETVHEIVSIVRQICEALEHAHARGIVHRDLKPENVIITTEGVVKLTDFGLARSAASRLTPEGMVVGTVFYLSPEQALGKEIDERTDLYALGVMLYELLSGQLPFTADDPLAVVSQHLHTPVTPPSIHNPKIPSRLDELIIQLMSKEKEGRPRSAAIVRQVLDDPATLMTPLQSEHRERPLPNKIRKEPQMSTAYLAGATELSAIRVLVVDDEPDVRRSLEKELQRSGFSVETASDCRSAMDKIQKRSFHVATIDLSMPDFDGQSRPTAGLDLVKRLRRTNPEIAMIVLTGRGSIETAIEAMKLGAADYFEKSTSSEDLGGKVLGVLPEGIKKRLIEETAKSINLGLKINLGRQTELIKGDEDEEVLRRLFVDASEINVREIARGTRNAAIYLIHARDDKGWRIPIIAKIDWKDAVAATKENFDEYVRGRISEFRYADIERVAYSTRRAGFLMTPMDAKDLKPLRTFFRTTSEREVLKAVRNLFSDTLGYWHSRRVEASLFLLTEYRRYLQWDREKVEKAIGRYLKEFAGQEEIVLEEPGLTFTNPLYLLDRIEQAQGSYLTHTYNVISHGDLSVTNILVDDRQNCWLIDFSSTGESHILRDFVELETSVKFDAQPSDDLEGLCALEAALMAQRSLGQELIWSHADPSIQKGFKTVRLLRQQAHHVVGPARIEMTEYYLGLLYHTLNMLRFLESQVNRQKKKCILYSAYLICQALESVM